MNTCARVKWEDDFGFVVSPNQKVNPYHFSIRPYGSPLPSFIGKDGINVYSVTCCVAVTNPDTGENTTQKRRSVIIEGSGSFSFIGEDGITVTEGTTDITTTDPETGEEITETVKTVTIGGGNQFSFIGEDGITVTESTTGNVTSVTISGGSKISIVGEDPITVTQASTGDVTTYTISANIQPSEGETVSIVAGDGITVEYADKTYTISTTNSIISYDFDPEWFSVTDGYVTFNTAKLTQVANDIAANTNVNISVTGVVDEVATGQVVINTTGITCLNDVMTNVSIQ